MGWQNDVIIKPAVENERDKPKPIDNSLYGNIMQSGEKRAAKIRAGYASNQSLPEDVFQTVGQSALFGGDVLGNIVEAAIKKVPQKIKTDFKQSFTPEGKEIIKAGIQKGAQIIEQGKEKYPRAARNIEAGAGIAGLLPLVKPAGMIAEKSLSTVGKGLEAGGKNILRSGMKLKDAPALKVGRNVDEGVQKIVDDVAKYNVASPLKGFKGMAIKSRKEITNADNIAKQILKDAAKKPENKASIDDILNTYIEDLRAGKIDDIPLGDEESAATIAEKLQTGLKLRGYSGILDVNKLNDAKKAITSGRKLFKKGAAKISEDPIAAKVNEIAYLKIMDKVNEITPEVKNYNQKIHDLIMVEKVAWEAKKRQGSWNKFGLTDMFISGMGMGGAAYSPKITMAALALLAGKKILSGGKIPSALIKTGKALQ